VQLVAGLDGLIHISQLANHHVERVDDIVRPGDEVIVKIIGIENERHRVKLSLRQVEEGAMPINAPLPPLYRSAVKDEETEGASSLRPEERFSSRPGSSSSNGAGRGAHYSEK
jgi:small subunit ribosomal protein S1